MSNASRGSVFLIAAVSIGGMSLLAQSAELSSEHSSNANLPLKWTAAWNSHNVDALVDLFTQDAVYTDTPFGLVNHGQSGIRAFAQHFFEVVPDLKITYLSSFVQGRHGTIEWIFSGTDVGVYKTGRTFSVRGVTVIEINGENILRNTDFYDLATIWRQLGLLPPGL